MCRAKFLLSLFCEVNFLNEMCDIRFWQDMEIETSQIKYFVLWWLRYDSDGEL